MDQLTTSRQGFLDDLHSKWILTDMKSKLVQIVCNLIEDEVYTKHDAACALMEVIALIELEEKGFNMHEARNEIENL